MNIFDICYVCAWTPIFIHLMFLDQIFSQSLTDKFVKSLQVEQQSSDLSSPAGDLSLRNLDSSWISRTNACDAGLFLFYAKGR